MSGPLDPFFAWLASGAPRISNGSEILAILLAYVAGAGMVIGYHWVNRARG